jgi:hypothetical protein
MRQLPANRVGIDYRQKCDLLVTLLKLGSDGMSDDASEGSYSAA